MSTVVDVLARLRADISNLRKGFNEADTLAAKTGANLKSMGDKTAQVGGTLTRNVTLPLVAAGGGAIAFSNQFNGAMANVATLIPGNTERVMELKGAVQDMATETGKSTGDLTNGLYQTISAFGDTADSVSILDTNARAARAGLAQTEEAIALTSAVTKAYGDTSAGAVQQAADLALMTVRLGQTTFPELAASIGKVTPMANELNISQEQLFGTMATFTGVTGGAAEVATQMRGALKSLMNPTDAATAAFKAAGFESATAAAEQLGMQGALKVLTDEATRSGKPLADFVTEVEAQTLALAGAGDLAEDWTSKTEQMGKASGTTSEAFKEATEGVNKTGFALEQAKQKAAVMTQQVGDALGPVLLELMGIAEPLVDKIGGLVDSFTEASPAVQRTVVAVAGAVAALGPLLVVGGKVMGMVGSGIAGFGKFSGALKVAAEGGSKAAKILGAAGKIAFGPWGIAIAVVVGALVWAYNNVEWFRDGVHKALRVVGDAFSKVWDVVKKVWEGQLLPFIEEMIFDWVMWFRSMKDDFSATWKAIVGYAKTAWRVISAVVGVALDVMMAAWERFGGPIMAQVQNVWNVIKGVIAGVMNVIQGIITTVMAVIRGDWSAAWEGIKGILDGVWKIITSLVTGAIETVKNLLSLGWAAIKLAASTAWDALKALVSKAVDGIKGALKAAWNGIKAAARLAWAAFKQSIHDALLGAWILVTEIIPRVVQWFRDLPGKIATALVGLWNALVGTLQTAWDGWVRIIHEGIPAMLRWFRDLPGKIIAALANLGRMLMDKMSGGIDDMKSGATSAWPKVVQWFRDLPGKIISGIGNLGSTLFSAGTDLIEGLWNGIKSMGSWIADKVSGFVSDVIPSPIKRALGISSPSKVAAALGQEVSRGLAHGVLDRGRDVIRAAERVADIGDALTPDVPKMRAWTPADSAAAARKMSPAVRQTVAADTVSDMGGRRGGGGDPKRPMQVTVLLDRRVLMRALMEDVGDEVRVRGAVRT